MQKLRSEFESLPDKIKKVHNDITKDKIQNFRRIFVNSNLDLEIITKIKEDIDSLPNEEISQEDKNRLKSLRTKLFNYLIKQYEINSQKEDLIDVLLFAHS